MSTQIERFNALFAQVSDFVSPAKGLKVTDASSASDAVETGKKVKDYQKQIEALRKELVGPLNDRVKAINEYAKGLAAPLNEVETHLKREIARFEDEQERIRQAELRKLEELREQERLRLEAEAAAHKQESLPESARGIDVVKNLELQAVDREIRREEKKVEASAISNVRRPWKGEVVNESVIPREYLTVDMTKINAAIRAGVREIVGVRIFQETTVAFGKTTAVPAAALADDYFGGRK
jgi:chromosome segregation ATPase